MSGFGFGDAGRGGLVVHGAAGAPCQNGRTEIRVVFRTVLGDRMQIRSDTDSTCYATSLAKATTLPKNKHTYLPTFSLFLTHLRTYLLKYHTYYLEPTHLLTYVPTYSHLHTYYLDPNTAPKCT